MFNHVPVWTQRIPALFCLIGSLAVILLTSACSAPLGATPAPTLAPDTATAPPPTQQAPTAEPVVPAEPAVATEAAPTQPAIQPSATTPPFTAADPCLTGTWVIRDFSQFVNTAMPAEIGANRVRYQSTSGTFRYTFNPDGTVQAAAEDFAVTSAVRFGSADATVTVGITGTGWADYRLPDGQTIQLSNFHNEEFRLSAEIDGELVATDLPATDLAWFSSESAPGGRLGYRCAGDTLELTLDPPGTDTPPQTVSLDRSK